LIRRCTYTSNQTSYSDDTTTWVSPDRGRHETPYADLVTLLLDAPHAAVLMARSAASTQSLRSVHFKTAAADWRIYLEREIDARSLTFEDRIRYEIARLKLLRAEARRQTREDDTEARDILATEFRDRATGPPHVLAENAACRLPRRATARAGV
jgi:hypothetical protein